MTDEATADIIRKWAREQATRDGVEAHAASTPSSLPWRYPYWPRYDVAWEEER